MYRKYKPKHVKLCPGCPEKQPQLIHVNEIKVKYPQPEEKKRLVNVVDMRQYKKKDTKITTLF